MSRSKVAVEGFGRAGRSEFAVGALVAGADSEVFAMSAAASSNASSLDLDLDLKDSGSSRELSFEYAIYVLGSKLPSPIDLWNDSTSTDKSSYGGTKREGIQWLQQKQVRLLQENVKRVLVVGGGALGIRASTFFSLSLVLIL